MSSYVPPYSIHVENSRPRQSKFRLRYVLVGIIGILVGVILFQIVWSYALLPNMKLKTFSVYSNIENGIEANRVKAIIGVDTGSVYPEIDVKRIEQQLMLHLPLEKVIVKKKFPDILEIHLIERIPLVFGIYISDEDRAIPMQFDKDGYLVSSGVGIRNYDMPVLSGDILFPKPMIGEILDSSYLNLVEKLSEIRNEKLELYQLISEVELRDKGGDHFEIIMYIRGHHVPLVLKDNFSIRVLLDGMVVLDALRDVSQDKKMAMIDCRSPQITFSYKKEEVAKNDR